MRTKKILLIKSLLAFILCVSIITQVRAKECDVLSPAQNMYEPFVPKEPAIIPPSPTSQVYQRFMGFQPNLSTGAVNITIPLHTVTFDDFTLPITMNYQSNGIKLLDTYFPLGYGWALHPGLRITRTIMGKEDEGAPDKNYQDHLYTDDCFFVNLQKPGQPVDSFYDIFTLSMPNGNISFLVEGTSIWDTNWRAITVDTPYKIEPLRKWMDGCFYGFKVTDENGIIYYFGNESSTKDTDKFIECLTYGVPNTYLLRKVVLPSKQEISFKWKTQGTPNLLYESCYTVIDGLILIPKDGSIDSPSLDSGEFTYAVDAASVEGSLLEQIKLPNGKIDFLYNGNILNQFSISNTEMQSVKQISFNTKDKLLQSVTIGENETYTFQYNTLKFANNTRAQDFWGYYNGCDYNRCNYPSIEYKSLDINIPRYVPGANRNPNEYYMKANILERITYPTGGYTSYEYEAHKYELGKFNVGGGLRVKQMTSVSNDGSEENRIVKKYKYGVKEDGKGCCTIEPNESTFISEEFFKSDNFDTYFSYRQLMFHANSLLSGFLGFNLPVWYNSVTEYNSDGSKTVYRYNYREDGITSDYSANINPYSRNFSLKSITSYEHVFDKMPQLIKKEVYDANGKKKSTEENQYTIYNLLPDISSLLCIDSRQVYTDLENKNATYNCSKFLYHDYVRSEILPMVYKLTYTTKEEEGVKTSIRYRYTNKGAYRHVITYHSDGAISKDEFLYANDDLSDLTPGQQSARIPISNMNRSTLPILTRKSINDTIVAQKVIQYKYEDKKGYILPEIEYYRIGNHAEEARIHYLKYNSKGKPVYVTVDGKKQVYVWGYLSQYPIAKIENTKYEEVQSILGDSLIVDIEDAIIPTSNQLELLNGLRSRLPYARVYTYAYKPLVGIISETSPQGTSIHYSYDSSGRLIEKSRTKTGGVNGQKELIESYKYNHKNK